MGRRPRKPDPTAAKRMRDLRRRAQAHERCPTIKAVGSPITDTMLAVGLLTLDELENNERLGDACKAALQMWHEDRQKWLELNFITRNAGYRKDGF
jgi:hypothetical protein